MTNKHPHIPILCNEIFDYLEIKKGEHIIDATIGFGGHSEHVLKHLDSTGQLSGIDQDQEALKYVKDRFKHHTNITFFHTRFSKIRTLINEKKLKKADKIIIDLGLSSYQLDQQKRGFSYLQTSPLDMRMNQQAQTSAASILETESSDYLTRILTEFGEIKNPSKLVAAIIQFRKKNTFKSNEDLKNLIKKSFFFNNNRNIFLRHYAQVFQALRIAVNNELDELDTLLNTLPNLLNNHGRIAFLSFHSIEDRKIKQALKKHPSFKMLHKHVIRAKQDEIKENRRSKPAKLRVYEFTNSENE
ncbi:MAG: 16S rRNA (cytosine(1402)-N(4))-methyltransferase RsmH [bacterium]